MMSRDSDIFLAVDAGGTYFKHVMADRSGELIDGTFGREPARSDGSAEEILNVYEAIVRKAACFAASSGNRLAGIAVSTPGPFDYSKGISLMGHKFKAVRGIPLGDYIRNFKFLDGGAPPAFIHDVHAFMEGERLSGALAGARSAAAVTIGTGLGFGIMKNGVILENAEKGPAVSIYSLPAGKGVLEDIVSGRGVVRMYREYAGADSSVGEARDAALRAAEGDRCAIGAFQSMASALAEGIKVILLKYGIDVLVLGGQVSKASWIFLPALEEKFSSLGLDISIRCGKHIELSPLRGALSLAGFLDNAQRAGGMTDNAGA